MCNVGGGTNRCLAHNPISKFVVKVVTVRTKADETLVNKTLGELSKEGKKLPSPEPEVVKSWVETEKFAAQYDPELSEHDRKIQINRLERAETENVNGGHFHAWKNLHRAVRSKMAKKIAAGGLAIGMSLSLVGCFANSNPNNSNTQPVVPTNAPSSYGLVIGSGEKVKTADGSYEKITVEKASPLYKFNNGEGIPDHLKAAGWTEDDAEQGQRLVVDYMVHEFVDSSALETGEAGYKEWHQTAAKKYYTGEVYNQAAASNSNAILGNFGGEDKLPPLIHDASPREKDLDLNVVGFKAYDDEAGTKGILYSVKFDAGYRVNDTEAVKFAASHTGVSPEQFLNSASAKPSLKDGKGENIYRAKGNAQVVVGKDAKTGKWNIIGFQASTDFDSSDFTDIK